MTASKSTLRRSLTLITGLGALALVGWMFLNVQEALRADQIASAVRTLSPLKLAVACFATLLSFTTLAYMEWLASKACLSPDYSRPRASLFAVITYGISNTFGFAGLASTPLRLRLYSPSPTDGILSLCALSSLAFWLGLVLLLGVSLVITAFDMTGLSGAAASLPPAGIAATGFALTAIAIGACWMLGKRTVKIGEFSLRLPDWRVISMQAGLAALDWVCASVALFALLPAPFNEHFFRFISGFMLSQVAALISSVPGGIGVLEGFNLLLFNAPKAAVPELAAAFLAYRSIYYLPPLVLSFLLFFAWSLASATSTFAVALRAVGSYGRTNVPWLSSLATAGLGLVLLLNSSGQGFESAETAAGFPAFWQSLLGTALLILAIRLNERSVSARKLTVVACLALAATAIYFGQSWIPASCALILSGVLVMSHREFYRNQLHGSSDPTRFSTLVLLPTFASMVLAIVAFYRHEIASREWWRIAMDPSASTLLRGSVGSLVALGAYGLWSALSPRARAANTAKIEALENSQTNGASDAMSEAILTSPYTTSWLALVGDKEVFRCPTLPGEAPVKGFIMYKVAGPYWIAMGDPVCAPADARKLLDAFLLECDLSGVSPVFYQTRPETLASYIESGFQAVKIGEEARVFLPEFSLEGRKQKSMRNTCSRIERDGYSFEFIDKSMVTAKMEELRGVSLSWLDSLSMREKGFSIGSFRSSYIGRCDAGVLKKDDRIVAFANIWVTGSKQEFSVDLMRYDQTAPSGAMEYLIIQLMLAAKADGYTWFNLGMAPLAGLEGIHNGRQWHRVGSMIYRAGEAFYNFRGLKAFKDKFGPSWEARFLVYPPGANLARILSAVAVLINFRSARRQDREAA